MILKFIRIIGAWTKCFLGIAWDYTYFIFDEANGELWILALSDSD